MNLVMDGDIKLSLIHICLSLVLSLGADELYQIMFWLAPSPEDNEMSLWIGALQGKMCIRDSIWTDLTFTF